MRWRDCLLIVPVLLAGVMVVVLMLGLPKVITLAVLGVSGGSIAAYLALEQLTAWKENPQADAANAPSMPKGDAS